MTRRTFLELTAAGTMTSAAAETKLPWYQTALRWGQTNITERDPTRYDIPWWREYWKRTAIQGVIINAGGIVAYYPSKFPLQHRAEFLNGRDLYGELAAAAHADGLAVVARMDSNRTAEDFFKAHGDWFARQKSGEPYRAADKYVTCVNSPYYDEYLPSVLKEIIDRSHPDGFADNSWSGLSRENICYCENCARKFKDQAGEVLPDRKDWNSPIYRKWIEWNYKRRLEIWDLNNETTKKAGGPHCIWMGMNSGSVTAESRSFRDLKEICTRSEMLLLDHQSRTETTGFQQNGDAGKLVHGLLGWNKLAPESMALYQAPSRAGQMSFRLAAKPPREAQMWMFEGIAGGIQLWWHHVGAYHEDRRAYHTAEPVFRWHKEHDRYLINRQPVATVGVVWSQRNTDYFGRDEAATLVDLPYRGITEALIKARIPYVPVNADHITRDAHQFRALLLPNVGALSDAQCAAIRDFVKKGGALIATGATSLYNEWGDSRKDFALADLFGAHTPAPDFGRRDGARSVHSYLRIDPAMRTRVRPVLEGFEETEILPFGGMLENMRLDPGVLVPLTFIPPFPVYPPETAWMRTPKTDIPALILNGRVAYLPAEIDSRFGRDNLADHARLLANLVHWAVRDAMPLEVRGPGFIDCHLYRQNARLILHLINLSNEATWRAPIEEWIPVGPLHVTVRVPAGVQAASARGLVSGAAMPVEVSNGRASFEVKAIRDHEVIVIG